MKHLFKKNQIIITTLAVMIAIAGYLNYSGKLFGDDPNSSAEANTEMVNQNKETLQALIDNTNISEEEKQSAVEQMVRMTQIAEQELAIETLMASKGFSESVVNLTEDSADIVVNAEELTDANRAQIEDIVTRKTEIAPENIVITPIHE